MSLLQQQERIQIGLLVLTILYDMVPFRLDLMKTIEECMERGVDWLTAVGATPMLACRLALFFQFYSDEIFNDNLTVFQRYFEYICRLACSHESPEATAMQASFAIQRMSSEHAHDAKME
jgi:hypothetical protein